MNGFKFELDRIVFDRSVWSIFFLSIVKLADQCPYDSERLAVLDLDKELVPTRFIGRGTENVLMYHFEKNNNPKPYLKIEMRVRATRAMKATFNFNRYFVQKYNLIHSLKTPVIHDDNFLPANTTIATEDYIRVFKIDLPNELETLYREKFSLIWPEEYERLVQRDEKCIVRCITLEVDREMSPLIVSDIWNEIKGKAEKHEITVPVHHYNSQSQTITFGERPESQETYLENDAILSADTEVWNWKEPYDHVRQGKLYQKTPNMGRFEITLYNQQIDMNSPFPIEDLGFALDNYAEVCGLVWKPSTRTRDEMIDFIAENFKIDKYVIYLLLEKGFSWKGTYANRNLTLKLKKRGILVQSGSNKNGKYETNCLLRSILNRVSDLPNEKPHYIEKFL